MADDLHTTIQQRMEQRLNELQEHSTVQLESTDEMFSSTWQMRSALEAQKTDATQWAALLETGSDSEVQLAEELSTYAAALDEALEPQRQAPHYQAVISGLESRLDQDQFQRVVGSEAFTKLTGASMENAMFSGDQLVRTGQAQGAPTAYERHKADWDMACSAGYDGANYLGYTPMAPLQEEVRSVMTDEQRMLHDQRMIESSMMMSHSPLGSRLGIDVLEREAATLYAAPMIKDTAPAPKPEPEMPMMPAPELGLHQSPGLDL